MPSWRDPNRPRVSMLMWVILSLWAFFGFGIHLLVNLLNAIKVAGFPLGFYMAAQGSLIAFVILLFFSARRQDATRRAAERAEAE